MGSSLVALAAAGLGQAARLLVAGVGSGVEGGRRVGWGEVGWGGDGCDRAAYGGSQRREMAGSPVPSAWCPVTTDSPSCATTPASSSRTASMARVTKHLSASTARACHKISIFEHCRTAACAARPVCARRCCTDAGSGSCFDEDCPTRLSVVHGRLGWLFVLHAVQTPWLINALGVAACRGATAPCRGDRREGVIQAS